MRRFTRFRSVMAAAAAGLALSGCVSTQAGDSPGSEGRSANIPSVLQGEGTKVRDYKSLSEVAAFSTDLVVGTASAGSSVVSASTNPNGTVKSTLVKFTIREVLGGKSFHVGDTIVLRQFGTGSNPKFNQQFDPILQEGKTYTAYLEPFYFEPGVSTGQYVIVGDVADSVQSESKSLTLTPGKSSLSSPITRDSLIQSVDVLGSKVQPLGLKQ